MPIAFSLHTRAHVAASGPVASGSTRTGTNRLRLSFTSQEYNAMRNVAQIAGLLALAVLVTAGCGSRAKPELDQPEALPSQAPRAPAAPTGQESRTRDPLSSAARATLEERIGFAYDQSELSPQARTILTAKAEVLRRAQDITLQVEGHADERGSDEYNLSLSNRRATAAKRFLVQQGVAPTRLETAGYGEERPMDHRHSESAWALNRRAEFRVTGGAVAQR
jgi:peptidoglycan-associated lipoprotein